MGPGGTDSAPYETYTNGLPKPTPLPSDATDLELQVPQSILTPAPRNQRFSDKLLRVLKSPVMLDWGAIVLSAIVAIILEACHARRSYVIKSNLLEWHRFPKKDNSVPSWTVPLYSLLAPLIIICVYPAFTRRPAGERVRVVTAIILNYALVAAITDALKVPIGRPRPNFVKTCWPDGNITFTTVDPVGGYALCDPSVPTRDIDEIYKSFPSGHSSLSASGLGFLMFWALGQLRSYSVAGQAALWRLWVPLLPGLGAVAVGVTRVVDYWHFSGDVFAGLLIGFVTAFIVYRVAYPPLTHARCDTPNFVLLREAKDKEQRALVV